MREADRDDEQTPAAPPQAPAARGTRSPVGDAAAGEIAPRALAQRLARGGMRLLDVREAAEWEVSHLPGAEHVPLGELPAALHRFAPTDTVAVYCRVGGRSAVAAAMLRAHGCERVYNLTGGLLAWARDCDPALPVADH